MMNTKKILFLFFLLTQYNLVWAVEYSESCGKEWQWTNPLPTGYDLSAVAWSQDQHQYVAVGSYGTILTSFDSITWQEQNSGTRNYFSDIKWNGSQWLAVGARGTLLSSIDAINWQQQDSKTTSNLSALSWNLEQQKWIVTSTDGFLIHSQDGIKWTLQDIKAGVITDIAWNGHQWMMVSFYGAAAFGSVGSHILISSDGTNWHKTTYPNYQFDSVSWNKEQNKWLIVSSGSNESPLNTDFFTSSDGISLINQINTTQINNAYWNGNIWLAVGEEDAFSSLDGFRWQPERKPIDEPFNDVIWNGKQWLAVGDNGSIITSNNSVNWEKRSLGSTNAIYKVHYDNGKWVAVGGNESILSSTDGQNWKTQIFGKSNHLNSVKSNGKKWVAVGGSISSSLIYISPEMVIYNSSDGISWQKLFMQFDKPLNDVEWNGKKWIAVGVKGSILSSFDGTVWEEQSSGTKSDLEAIHWNGEKWIAVGGLGGSGEILDKKPVSSVIISSIDGVNWTTQKLELNQRLRDIHWNGKYWLAVGGYSSNYINGEYSTQRIFDFVIISSTDGIIWTTKHTGDNNVLRSITWDGKKWLVAGQSSSILYSYDSLTWDKLDSSSDATLNDIHWNGEKYVAVSYSGTILTSNCYPKNKFIDTQALIIAGGGNPNDPLQEATNQNANLAYRTLRERGISTDNIKYFNPMPQDADKDGVIDTVEGIPTKSAIQSAITEWSSVKADIKTPVLVYLIDHGGSNVFYLNKPSYGYAEVIKAEEVASWLNELQDKTQTRVSLIYDACHSGSFMDELKQSPAQDYDRSLLFSSTPEQLAYFGAKGNLSFSHFFWNNIGQGMDLRTAHRSATVAVRATTQNEGNSYQTTLIDDNGDGVDNYVDGSLAYDTYLGIDNNQTVIYPQIIKHQGSTTVSIADNAQNSLDLFARLDLETSQIERVWAIVIPPNSKTTGSEAITELPVIELDDYQQINGQYHAKSEAVNSVFTQSGQYTVSYYAQTKAGVNSRFPLVSLITVTDANYQALEQKNINAIIVVAGEQTNAMHKGATNNANLAYRTLRSRGVNKDNIYYLNNVAQDVDADGQTDTQSSAVSSESIEYAIATWASTRVNSQTPLLIYMIGDGINSQLVLNNGKTAVISDTSLAFWINRLQSKTNARVTFVYDAPYSGSFMSAMTTPAGSDYERINIFSAKANQGAYFGADGQLSFSHFFWSHTARGLDVRRTFLNTLRTMRTATSTRTNNDYQQAQLDDNGDGIWNSQSDGSLAKVTYLGLNAATASTFPVVFTHQGDRALQYPHQQHINIQAKVDLPPEFIDKVWVLVSAPGKSVNQTSLITQLPKIKLTYNPQTLSYEAPSNLFTERGDYNLTYYAQSKQGNISEPINSIVQVNDSGVLSLNHCATVDSELNINLPCVVLGNDVYQVNLSYSKLSQQQNNLTWFFNNLFPSPDAIANENCTDIDEQLGLYLNCINFANNQYTISLDFFTNTQNPNQLFWEFGEVVE